MATPSKLARKIAALARKSKIVETEKALKAKERKKDREAVALANELTPDGFNANMRAKLIDASKRANDEPRAKAFIEKAVLEKRVEQLRREKGIGQVSPPLFYGEPADARGAPIVQDPKRAIPPSVGEQVSKDLKEKKL